jgi:hypothetical protein
MAAPAKENLFWSDLDEVEALGNSCCRGTVESDGVGRGGSTF